MHRLPVHDTARAAALRVTLGCTLEPRSHREDATGKESASWAVTDKCGDAGQILEAWAQNSLPPGHPFRAAMLGIQAAATLREWLRRTGPAPGAALDGGLYSISFSHLFIPPAHGSPLATIELRAPDECDRIERATLAETFRAGLAFPVLPHHVAAAAFVSGFLPIRLSGTAARPVLHLTARADTWPGLTLDTLTAAAAGGLSAPVTLGTAAPGEHPFFYAWEAIRTFCGFRYAESLVAKNPLHYFRGEGLRNPRTAVVSHALLSQRKPLWTGKTPEQHLAEHLAGV